MIADIPQVKESLDHKFAIYWQVQEANPLRQISTQSKRFGYFSLPYQNSSQIVDSTDCLSIESTKQYILEKLSTSFDFEDQKVTLDFISSNTWLVWPLIECHIFLEKELKGLKSIALQYNEDIQTLYINTTVSDYNYDRISKARDSFFDFLIPQTNLFKVLNISISPDEV